MRLIICLANCFWCSRRPGWNRGFLKIWNHLYWAGNSNRRKYRRKYLIDWLSTIDKKISSFLKRSFYFKLRLALFFNDHDVNWGCSDVYFKSLPRCLTFLFDKTSVHVFTAKTVLLSSKQVMKLIFILFGYYYHFDNNKIIDFKLLKCRLDFNKFVYCRNIFFMPG